MESIADRRQTEDRVTITGFKTACAFWSCGTCSESMMHVLNRALGQPMATEERGAMPLAGGIVQQGYQCGMVWGAALAAGARAHALYGAGPKAEAAAVLAGQRLVALFRERNRTLDCAAITDTDWTKKSQMLLNFLRGGPIACTTMAMRFAPAAHEALEQALAQPPAEKFRGPVSCASRLIRQLGLGERHAVMAAALAGGIGLSGGACGALGAAVWVIGMSCANQGLKFDEVNTRAAQTLERFLEVTDYELECAAIVGRPFEGVGDHVGHLRQGGCDKIIHALAWAVEDAVDLGAEQLSA